MVIRRFEKFGILALMMVSMQVFSQTMSIPYSSKPTIDGKITSMEWQQADTFEISINNTRSTYIYLMHDTTNLYVAFAGNLQSGGNYFPEVLIDPKNDTSRVFNSDDWWFHVSGTDCESKGTYGVYNNCKAIQNDWKAVPNFINHGPVVDTVEIEIPLSKLGLSRSDTFHLGFLLNNFRTKKIYPSGANHLDPSGWQVVFFDATTSLKKSEMKEETNLIVYPNPTNRFIKLANAQNNLWYDYTITDIKGRIIAKERIDQGESIDLNKMNLLNGIYHLEVMDSNQLYYRAKIMYAR